MLSSETPNSDSIFWLCQTGQNKKLSYHTNGVLGIMKLAKWLYGDRFQDNGENTRAECLACGKDALEISNEGSHHFQCWSCKASGNAYTLIQMYYDLLPKPNKGTINPMLKLKPGTTFKGWRDMGLRLSDRGYICPCHNTEGKVVSLYRFAEDNNCWYSTPKPVSLQVMGLASLSEDQPIMVLEGHADYNVALSHFSEAGYDLLGLCGSSFPTKLLKHLEERDVVFLGDNDEAGRQGSVNLATRAKKNGMMPARLRYLDWEQIGDVEEKADIRDLALSLEES